MYSIVRSYIYGEGIVVLMTDENHLDWIVGIEKAGREKWLRCLGCEQGLNVFDQCINGLRRQALEYENLDIKVPECEMN